MLNKEESMRFFRFLGTFFSVLVAALAGNWVGERLRELFTGQSGHAVAVVRTDDKGETTVGADIVVTNYLPGLLAAFVGKPRWLWAFMGGALASGLIGDRYETYVSDWLEQAIGQGQEPAGPCERGA
jgi:hypothetical protein